MPVLDRGDVGYHYTVEGDGPPLVLLAGTASDGASWAPLRPYLTPHFTVICPDNRTTGQTVPSDAPVSVELWAEDAAALITEIAGGRAHVAGHSLGGLIALHLAAKAPASVDRLALLASAPLPLARNAALFRVLLDLRTPGQPPDLWLRAFFPWIFHPRAFEDPAALDTTLAAALGYPHAQTPSAFARQLSAAQNYDVAGLAAEVTCPTLALLAADDLLIPAEPARTSLAAIADLRVEVLPDSAHALHWDAPRAVATHLTTFFAV